MSYTFTTPVPLDVQDLFDTLTLEVIGRGFAHYSADAILHRIRWHFQIDIGNRHFKCNNDWTAELARWFMDRHPQHKGFFRLRVLRKVRVTHLGYQPDLGGDYAEEV